jgi:hypothetical protein
MRLSFALALLLLAGCAAAVKAPPEKVAAATAAPPPAAAAAAPSTPAAAPAVRKPAAAAPAPAPSKPAAAPPERTANTLDLKVLEEQIKGTKAIGVMTKLSLKNQVDDLVEQFRAYYQGRVKTTLADLRRPYELLLMKVLAVLQDGDPALAKAINASREAIWGILADRDKFSRAVS